MTSPISKNMQLVLDTIKLAGNGEVCGNSIVTWLGFPHSRDGVRESLRALTNRGLIVMRPMDDPTDEFRKLYPDRLKAMYSIKLELTKGLGE